VVVLSFLTPDAEKGLINRDLALGRTPHVPSQPSVSFVTFRSNRLSWAFFCKTGTENDSSFVSLTPDAEKVLINRDLALPHAPRPLPTLCILRYLLFKLIVFAFFCKGRDLKWQFFRSFVPYPGRRKGIGKPGPRTIARPAFPPNPLYPSLPSVQIDCLRFLL
jgi:hypothetical protein